MGAPPPDPDDDRARRQFDTIAENASLALFILDERQRCTYMNRAAEQLTGYALAEVRGRPLHDVIHHTRPDGTPFPSEECPIDRAFPQSMREQGEEVFVHKDGSFYPVAFTASPIHEGVRTVGTVVEVRGVRDEIAARDTLRRALNATAEANERLRCELDGRGSAEAALRERTHTLEIVNRVNARLAAELAPEKLIQTVTDAGIELTGAQYGAFFYNTINERGEALPLYTLSGAPLEAFSHFPIPRATAIFHPTFAGEGIIRSDDITRDPRYGHNAPFRGMPDGHLPVRSYLAVPVMSHAGEALGGMFFGHEDAGVFTDAAERLIVGIADQAAIAIEKERLHRAAQNEAAVRRRAEADLRELNQTLEQRVVRRTAELEARNRELHDFTHVASHDLQEPLRKIQSFASLLEAKEAGRLSEEGAHLVARMQESARRMSGLIRDLLALSRVTTQSAAYARVDLGEVMEGVLSDLQLRIVETGGRVDVGALPALEADPVQMRQLLQNLVGNALKFHRDGVPPVVRVAAAEDGERVRLTVEDNGIGFDERYADRIFAPFQRLHSKSAYDGTGIGLSIVRRIAERHAGDVEVESVPGAGSRFVVVLPLRHV